MMRSPRIWWRNTSLSPPQQRLCWSYRFHSVSGENTDSDQNKGSLLGSESHTSLDSLNMHVPFSSGPWYTTAMD